MRASFNLMPSSRAKDESRYFYFMASRVHCQVPYEPAVEPIQIILLSINLFVKDWFVGWLNGSLDARYSAIHSWHP